MTIQDFINTGIELQGHVSIKCIEEGKIYYDGELFYTKNIRKVLDREITYIYPYIAEDDFAAICIEIAEKE